MGRLVRWIGEKRSKRFRMLFRILIKCWLRRVNWISRIVKAFILQILINCVNLEIRVTMERVVLNLF